ncbi:MAG TPA: pyridoxal-phosphate dependent enzyme [Gammaproteobacteria bacterium]|nr:pyridoxal-phosphate dependent enzyme [Gammaproteobacteria bacterium]
MAIYQSVLDTVGRTPVVRLHRLAPEGVELYVKLESANPMGSVKDRAALAIIEQAEADGTLQPGQTVVEATSGNTGISLAMVCARKGYPLVVVMAENFSVERRRLMRFMGAQVVLTPAAEKGSGMLAKAVELARTHGWFLCRQFENEANADVHAHTTAQEILADFAASGLDYWVTGAGTGGTLSGVARALREHSPGTRVVVCEPDNAPMLGSGIPQPDSAAPDRAASHPMFRPHLMQGWSPDFIPELTQRAITSGLVDEFQPVNGAEALATARLLAAQEGILAGTSGGATLAGALALCKRVPAGSRVLCMLPDTGERYLSTPLFADVAADMDEAERLISASTPGFRFDLPAAQAPTAAAAPPETDAETERYVAGVITDPQAPVVMFALEWCEFCWSVRRLFERLEVPCRVVSVDSVEFQAGDRGGRIRAVLRRRTGAPTIPQVFIGGKLVGGCTDVFDAFKTGELQAQLAAAGVPLRDAGEFDPYALLPGWLHAR